MEQKPVTVTLTTVTDGEDTVTARYDGLLRVVGGKVLITYTEKEDGAVTSTLLSLTKDSLTLSRRGGVVFDAVYAVGKPHSSIYRIGGMAFDAHIVTESLAVLATALPSADCVYRLTLGGEERRFALSLRLAEGRCAV